MVSKYSFIVAINQFITSHPIKIILLCVFLSSYVAYNIGIHQEFKSNVSKNMSRYADFYQAKRQISLVKTFGNAASYAIQEWQIYHIDTDKIQSRDKALTLMEKEISGFSSITLNQLPVEWQIYALYNYAYLHLICADIESSRHCLGELNTSLNKITDLINANQTQKLDKYLKKTRLHSNIPLLRAQYAALLLAQDINSADKLANAKKALKEYGEEKMLRQKEIDKDRILSDVFKLTFVEDNDTKKGYQIPVKQ